MKALWKSIEKLFEISNFEKTLESYFSAMDKWGKETFVCYTLDKIKIECQFVF